MKVLSLFSGIGALELGLERAGMDVVGQVEIDPFCRRVLAKHWPGIARHDDVRTAIDWWNSEPRPRVDVAALGFPCQDISSAHTNGARAGLDGARSGLWYAARDIVADLEPRWVIIENSPQWRRWVPGVRRDLHTLGYASVPLQLSAGSFGAPHKRPRVVVVAHADSDGEPLRAFHAEVAGLRPVPRGSGYWREPFTGAVRVDDGTPYRMVRLRAVGNSVVPFVGDYVGGLVMRSVLAAQGKPKCIYPQCNGRNCQDCIDAGGSGWGSVEGGGSTPPPPGGAA